MCQPRVVEPLEMEGGEADARESKSSSSLFIFIESEDEQNMNRHQKSSVFRPGDRIGVRGQVFHEDGGSADKVNSIRGKALKSALGPTQSSSTSELHFAQNMRSTLHPITKIVCTESEISQSLPINHAVNFNSHGGNKGCSFSKQLDNTRRDAAMSLSEKREMKAELVRKESERSVDQTISICRMARYSISMSSLKLKEAIFGVFYTFEPWYSSIKLIEGNFGSGLASYFRFLRWLFLLNLATLLISLSFLVVPQILARFYFNFNEEQEVTQNGGTYFEKRFFDPPDVNGTLPPPLTAAALLQKNNIYRENEKFSPADIFTGEGFFTATTMYYGFYKNGTLELFEGYPYDLANAYFFSMVVCYILILITVSVSMARSYRKTFIETRGTHKIGLALKVFTGWDFSIATPEAASLNQRRLYIEIKEALNEEEFQNRNSSCLTRLANVTVQLTLNFLFFFLLGGIAFLMWELLGRHYLYLKEKSAGGSNIMTMATVTSLIMNVLPIGFSWIARYEDYRNPRTALYVTLLRTFLLNIVVIGTISAFWLTHSQDCWETALGQEVYRLFITDFIISLLFMAVVDTIRSFVLRMFWKDSEKPEFDIAWNTLNLIYNQTLFLVGFYFSPLLAAVIVIKLFLTFYIKRAGALYNCQPPKKSWRAAQTETLFLILTFITLLGVFLVFGYIIFKVSPSDCGPFAGYKFMYEAILNGIFQLEGDHLFLQIVMYLVKPGVVGGILIAMSITSYILHAKAQAHAIEVDILRAMLVNEAKDKAFLFKHMKQTEERSHSNVSPVSSSRSSTHTPLSERRQLKRGTRERESSFYSKPEKSSNQKSTRRKYDSTSNTSSGGSWRFTRSHELQEGFDMPGTGSGASSSTCDIELSEFSQK